MSESLIEPILDLVETGTAAEQITALDALLNLPLGGDDVERLAATLARVLDSEADPAVLEKAAEIPIPEVQERLREIAAGGGAAARAAQVGLGTAGDAAVAPDLVEHFERTGDLGALVAIAALPPGSVPRQSRRLRAAAKSDDRDVQFWASVALAKAGRRRHLRRMMKSLADDADEKPPTLFWGDPWSAWDAIAAAAPVPAKVHDYLASELDKGDLSRNQRITAGALTNLADAEGTRID